ncbi:hypothetical protein EK21DRAFT_89074 [Setomelanomma holmii]|uniref:Uncharacterized protein n=1 Tax=Setomelanomma holmii TaxID=210430 RepID=A0A9P4HB56_9PLEO|nr:hypothetical protein EK21DRAFT_89074 [Setomelanomma holmii]
MSALSFEEPSEVHSMASLKEPVQPSSGSIISSPKSEEHRTISTSSVDIPARPQLIDSSNIETPTKSIARSKASEQAIPHHGSSCAETDERDKRSRQEHRRFSGPPYIFRIDEVREHPAISPISTVNGHWKPSSNPGWNYKVQAGVTNMLWYNEGSRIRFLPAQAPSQPSPFTPFKTYSIFFSEGLCFWVLHGDATEPPPQEVWHELSFDEGDYDTISLSSAGATTAHSTTSVKIGSGRICYCPTAIVVPKVVLSQIWGGGG